jgi:hypothetical protein
VGNVSRHQPVKLIVGLIFSQVSLATRTKTVLNKQFGRTDFESPVLDFTYTDYYDKEFGKGLKRQFISFQRLINPQDIAGIKQLTNRLERQLAQRVNKTDIRRQVNIDPGYLELPKLVLATTKDFSHRIYLKNGIFAEVTLVYRKNSFEPLEWTYPDYRTSQYIEIFNHIRQIYTIQVTGQNAI